MDLQADLQRIAESTEFSGVALVVENGQPVATLVRGLANRTHQVTNALDTRFALASGTKGFTALTIASLIESGLLELRTTLAEVVGPALSVDPAVTIEQLLGHTSGVGDYVDEELLNHVDDHTLGGASAHRFERPHHYIPILNQYPQVSSPGERFAYNNSGYVMLALVAERVGGRTFDQLVRERVFEPAGMDGAAFLRSDELPADAAIGYLENGRSNVFHLPVIGSGDGGAYATANDLVKLWQALLAERIVPAPLVDAMTAVRQILPSGQGQYGLGFWLAADGRIVMLEGMDAGVSFQSALHRESGTVFVIMSNTSSGVWPLSSHLLGFLEGSLDGDGFEGQTEAVEQP